MSSFLPQSSRLFDALLQKSCPTTTTTTTTHHHYSCCHQQVKLPYQTGLQRFVPWSIPYAWWLRGTVHQVRSRAVCHVTLSDIHNLPPTLHHTYTQTRKSPHPPKAQAMQESFPACSKRLSPSCLLYCCLLFSFMTFLVYLSSQCGLHPQHKATPALPHSSYLPLASQY